MKQQFYPKNILESIIVVLLFFMISGIFSVINIIFNEPINKHIIGAIGMIIGIILTKKILERTHSQKYIFTLNISFKSNISFLVLIITFIISLLIPLIKFIIFKMNPELISINPINSIFFILGGLIVAPIVEEVLFRGIILKGLLTHYTPHKAIAISSGLFAIIHLNIIQLFTSLIMGYFLGLIFYKTKSLGSSIIFHFFINLTITLFSFLHYKFGNPEINSITDFYGQYSIHIIVLSLLVFIILCINIYYTNYFSIKPKLKGFD